jgi:hypothetical protein
MLVRRLTACFLFAALLTARGEAAVTYSSVADSAFTIGRDRIELGFVGGSKSETGTGLAFFSGTGSPDDVMPLAPATLHVVVSGSAFAPPDSTASSTSMSGHIFRIENLGGPGDDTSTIEVTFTFTYSWDIDLFRDFPATEFASAGAFFHIDGIDNEFLFIDGVGLVPEYLDTIPETTAGGGTGSSGTVTITGKIIVPEETLSEFSVITDASGSATAIATPEPASLIMWSVSALGCAVGAYRRRKRA